ncbi:unspecified product [Plasmodium ovale curtisi]|uniref:Unspecified product n=1 Tax=Plasmodium ovale curtisi TaxID=864141 RepID=A0A1A8X7P8_PLAOA|nr:unspecified product [Plasmodium ovale curtisi]SBT01275.1 unspecified product [Plasmodium ovale curtisi]
MFQCLNFLGSRTFCKSSNEKINPDKSFAVVTSRLLKGETEVEYEKRYSSLKEKLTYYYNENDSAFPEQIKILIHNDSFPSQCNPFYFVNFKNIHDSPKFIANLNEQFGVLNYDSDLEKHLDKLKYHGYNKKFSDELKYDKKFNVRHTKERQRFSETMRYNIKEKKKRKSRIRLFLKKLNSRLVPEMLRFLRSNSSSNKPFVKDHRVLGNILHFINKYKVFHPLIISGLIYFSILVICAVIISNFIGSIAFATSFAVISFCIYFLMGIYYLYIFIKARRIKKISKKFYYSSSHVDY